MIPKDHPRYESLMIRERLVEGVRKGVAVLEGLIAHGRGEAFDYLIGERSPEVMDGAYRAAAAMLLLAKDPVISVNGNVAALCPKEVVELAREANSKLEVNLFHRSRERAERIAEVLKRSGAEEVLGVEPDEELEGLSSERRKVSSRGIYRADVVLLAIEDGDRTEALVRLGKKVIAIDLNPLSRTSRMATVTIVDNVIRAFPRLKKEVRGLREEGEGRLSDLVSSFDNKKSLKSCLEFISRRLRELELEKADR